MITKYKMVNITLTQLQKALYKVISLTYLKELIKQTPGDGETHNNWDIRFEGKDVIIFNEPTGDNILFTNDGTKEHIIRAKNKKFLRFKILKNKPYSGPKRKIEGNIAFEKDGYLFAKAVFHPGIQAKHFVEKIMNDKELERKAKELLEKEIESLITK